MWVVHAFDEREDRHLHDSLRLETVAVDEFAFERREEALGHRVSVAIATTDPIYGCTPINRQRLPKANEVYWQPWSL